MPIFKEVWQFASPGITGASFWSEVYYSSLGSIGQAAGFTLNFLRFRLALLAPQNKLLKIRVSDIANPRSTVLVQLNQAGQHLLGTVPMAIDQAIVANISSTVAPGRRKLWLRGGVGPSSVYAGDCYRDSTTGNDVFSPTIISLFTAFIANLASNGYIVLVRQKANAVGFTPFNCIKVDGTPANGTSILTLSAPPGFAVGSQILAAKFSKKDFPALSGTFTVLAVNGALVTIPYVTPLNDSFVPLTGYVRQLGYLSTAVLDPGASGLAYIGGRKSKGPFSGSRGAKSATRRLRYQS